MPKFFFFVVDKYKNVKSFTKSDKKENEIEDNIIKDIRILFKSKGKYNTIKDKVLRDIRALFELDEDDYYKPIRTGNAFSSNYIKYESNGDKDKSLSIKEYLNKIRPYLSHMIKKKKKKKMENWINNGN